MAYRMNKWQKQWLEALESGEYRQTVEKLHDDKGFCCLGVACEILDIPSAKKGSTWMYDGCDVYASAEVVQKLHLHDSHGALATFGLGSLANMNDAGSTFAQIAKFIRENPDQVFANYVGAKK
jgi:hypothetical protein